MLTVTPSLSQAFESQLSLRNIPDQQRRDFHKWLRFYLDYCAKYTYDPTLTASFAGFDEKLKSKGQFDAQRKQARRSIGRNRMFTKFYDLIVITFYKCQVGFEPIHICCNQPQLPRILSL